MNFHPTLKAGFTAALLALPLVLGAASANAATLGIEAARVRLPNGQVLTINDGNNWYQDQRVVAYKRYYYEPRERTYVVYNGDDRRHPGHFIPHYNNRHNWNDHHDNRGHDDHDNHGDDHGHDNHGRH